MNKQAKQKEGENKDGEKKGDNLEKEPVYHGKNEEKKNNGA